MEGTDGVMEIRRTVCRNIHDCDFFLFVFVNYRQRGLILPNAATEHAISYVRMRCTSFSYLLLQLSGDVFGGAAPPACDPISVLITS